MAFKKDKNMERDNLKEELEEEKEKKFENNEGNKEVRGESVGKPEGDQIKEEEELSLINDELMLKLSRMQADYNNLKRRTDNEMKRAVDYGIEILACELLAVIDNFERALEAENDKEASFYKGVEMIYNQLIESLNKMNIEEIDALNNPFDPNWHDAILVEESEEYEEGIVIGVLQKGYKIKDKVIRPSMVKVSK